MTFSTRNFDPLPPLAPKYPKFCIRPTNISFFAWNTVFPSSQTHRRYKLIFIPLAVREVQCQNWQGGWASGASQKFWDPLLISATIEGSNFKFDTQRRFAECVTITALVSNLVGAGWSTGAPQKLCEPCRPYHVTCTTQHCRNVIKLQI